MTDSSTAPDWRKVWVMIVVVCLAFGVMFIGTRQQEKDRSNDINLQRPPQTGLASDAKTYKTLMNNPHDASTHMKRALKHRAQARPGLRDEVKPNPGAIPTSLKQRATRRAFAGAPPTIPHGVNQQSASNCLSCHRSGLKIGARVAPAMSHEFMSECTQCHVVSSSPSPAPELGAELIPLANAFEPLREPVGGERAFVGAPPTIPHSTHMRTNCVSCHGVMGLPGLRSTHPWRASCTQCHSPAAAFEQSPELMFRQLGSPSSP